MTSGGSARNSIELARVVQAVDPSVRLAPARLVRRVIRRHFDFTSSQRVAHDFAFEVSREELLTSLSPEDVGGNPLPDRIVLLPLPADDDETPPDRLLLDYWRWLFHAAIDREVERRGGGFDDDPILFNAALRHEIRSVLIQERRLTPPEDDWIVYREFVALFLEQEYFAPGQISSFFPGLMRTDRLAQQLETRYRARALLETTRPMGAENPLKSLYKSESDLGIELPPPLAVADAARLQSQALRAAEQGNDVRSAILHRRLGYLVEANERLQRLVQRLQTPLRFDQAATTTWVDALRPLLHDASRGFWPAAGRLLYELQKACLDVERKVFAVDAVEWLVTWGRQPIKRLLDKPRQVNVLRRLRRALRLLPRTQLTTSQRDLIDHLLNHAVHEIETIVRRENGPILHEVLEEVGLVPGSQSERVVRGKLVEELLDVLCARGFLKMSDLRDAIARNRLKLNDLTGPGEFLFGDPLIRANRKLPLRLDGIYRRGEIYMRFLQRGSSLAFGTWLGRLIVLWLVLPFGGSYVILEGLHHFIEAIEGLRNFVARHVIGSPGSGLKTVAEAHHKPWLTSNYAIGVLGLFLLGLIHWPAFRRDVGRCARIALIDGPTAVRRSPWVRGLFLNPVTRFVVRDLLTPLLVGGAALVIMRFLEFTWDNSSYIAAVAAVATVVFFRTSWGRGFEERLDETMSRVWRIVSVNFLIGILTAVLSFFQVILELIDRAMYAVDEWLRFREGDNAISFVFKLVFGMVWWVFAYLFRFAWNLLIEPQINPIKHFPVVTVSHKLLLPLIPSLANAFGLLPATMAVIVSLIPGIFGFLVWELKENWKLYKANRPRRIGPAAVGSHGERVRGLLRPGLHSGVVPKTYAKLRKAEMADNHARAVKLHHHLHHVAEAIHRLAEREFASYLKISRRWGGLPIHVEPIRLATNRLRVPLTIHHYHGTLIISIEERGGWLIGSIEEHGWFERLNDNQRTAFRDALTEFYKLAGVHVVREQAAAVLDVEAWRIDCRPEGIVVLSKGLEEPVAIDYTDEPRMTPSGPIDGRVIASLEKSDLVLSDCPLAWERWVERWEQDHDGKQPWEPLVMQRVM